MLTDDENDFHEKMKAKLDAQMQTYREAAEAAQSEAWIQQRVPVFVRILDEAFRRAGLVRSKTMTNLIKDIISTHPNPSIEETTRIIQDFGDFSREAGLGPNPFK